MKNATQLRVLTLRQAHAFRRAGHRGHELYTLVRDWLCDSGRAECVDLIPEWTGLNPPAQKRKLPAGPKFLFAAIRVWYAPSGPAQPDAAAAPPRLDDQEAA